MDWPSELHRFLKSQRSYRRNGHEDTEEKQVFVSSTDSGIFEMLRSTEVFK